MWINSNEHVGIVTLSKLLDQSSTNLLEVELWKLVVAWANDQCALRGLMPTNANKRALINQVINKITNIFVVIVSGLLIVIVLGLLIKHRKANKLRT